MIGLLAMLTKEWMQLLRSQRAVWLLALILLAGGGSFMLFWSNQSGDFTDLQARASFARHIFDEFVTCQMIVLSGCAALLASGSITAERERQTLDLLACSGLARSQIVMGKWFATVGYLLLLILMLLPIEALVFSLGGVSLGEYLSASIMIVMRIAAAGMLGVYVSCRSRRSWRAMMTALVTLFLWDLGTFIVLAVVNSSAAANSMTAAAFVLAPFDAMIIVALMRGSARRFEAGERADLPEPWEDEQRRLRELRVRPIEAPEGRRSATFARRLLGMAGALGRRNPVFIREVAFGTLGDQGWVDLGMLAALFLSLLLCPLAEHPDRTLFVALAGLLLFSSALTLSTWMAACICMEREQKTWDLLRVTPLGDWRILLGKLGVFVNLSLGMGLVMAILPLITLIFSHLMSPAEITVALAQGVWMTVPSVVGFVFFYGALFLYLSSRSPSRGAAIGSAFGLLCIFNLLPLLMRHNRLWTDVELIQGWGMWPWYEYPCAMLRHLLLPILSPISFYADTQAALAARAAVAPIVAQFTMLALFTMLLLRRAVRCIRRADFAA